MINKIIEEYKQNVAKDDDAIYNLKQWIEENLTLQEKRILILFADEGSYRKTAKHLNCSYNTVGNYIKKIRNKINNGYINTLNANSRNHNNSN